MFKLSISLISLLPILCINFNVNFADIRLKSGKYCDRRLLRNDNNGIIKSHDKMRKRFYSNNMNCDYIIQAPLGYRIYFQPTFLSIESDKYCGFDNIFIKPVADGIHNIFCGSKAYDRIITNSSRATLTFTSDASLTKEGFTMRYVFMRKDEALDIIDQLANNKYVTTRNNDTTNMCPFKFERKCGINSDICIHRNWFCDGIKDCPNGEDEAKCSVIKQCHHSQLKCDSGQCLDKAFWCDGEVDCRSKDDESEVCQPLDGGDGTTTPDPNKPPIGSTVLDNAQCGIPTIAPDLDNDGGRIVGGKVVKPGSWPWTVSIRGGEDAEHFCGGSILNKRWILTAAHCIGVVKDMHVDAGRFAENGGNTSSIVYQRVKVKRAITHPGYNQETMDKDVAVMELEDDLLWTDNVSPICATNMGVMNNEICRVTGWGDTKGTGGQGYLKQASVPIVGRKKCRQWYANQNITQNMICAGYESGGVDSCQGDSGGPLVCQDPNNANKWWLVGVTSWGLGCAEPNRPGVYANMKTLLTWISRTISTPA